MEDHGLWERRLAAWSGTVGYRAAVWLIYALVAGFILGMWATDVREFVSLNGYYRATLLDMVAGKAHRPFAYRLLVPLVTRGVLAVLPAGLQTWMRDVLGTMPSVARGLRYLSWERSDLPTYFAVLAVLYGCLCAYLATLRRMTRRLYDLPAWLADLAPLVSLAVLPMFFKRGTHLVYDFATLFLFLLGLEQILCGRAKAYYAVFVLGLLNKETTILLTLVYYLWHRKRLLHSELYAQIGAQLLLFGVSRGLLALAFRGNPGGLVEAHLIENLRLYMRPYWFTAVVDLLAVVLLIGWHWLQKPGFLRICLVLAVPFLPLFLVAGGYGEIRAFYELYPVAFLLGFQSVAEILGWPMIARTF
jgi:hypothetical protein